MAQRTTKADLVQRVSELEAKLAEAQAELNQLYQAQRPSRAALAPVPSTGKPVSEYRLAAQRARELAMRTGAVVKLG